MQRKQRTFKREKYIAAEHKIESQRGKIRSEMNTERDERGKGYHEERRERKR